MKLRKLKPPEGLLDGFDERSSEIEAFTATPNLAVLKSVDKIRQSKLLHVSVSKQNGDGYPKFKDAVLVAKHFFGDGTVETHYNPGQGEFSPMIEFWGKLPAKDKLNA